MSDSHGRRLAELLLVDSLDDVEHGLAMLPELQRRGLAAVCKNAGFPASLYCAVENEAARTAAAAVRASGFATLIAAIEQAKALGELPADSDTLALARFYSAIIQGMSVQAIDGASASALSGLVDIALAAWPGRRPTNAERALL